MQFPESWLREFCDPPLATAQLAELLTMAGMEVEDVRPAAPPFSGVVVAHVLEVVRHPQADRLSVCTVDAGGGGTLQVVCGAPNVRAGMKAALARVGAELPPAGDGGAPFVIGLGKLRGIDSEGMLCSARELKLSDDHSGLLALADDAPVGADVRRLLDLDDAIFTLKLTPNLGHALSVYGIAREVAALTGAPLKTPAWEPAAPRHDTVLPVTVEAPDLCGRFSGRIVRNVDTRAATPRWMVERLARCGQRPVSALVDISNYVMFEFGRPSHIFDLDRIDGGLVVRWGRAGERLELLNGSTVGLDPDVGVIADRSGRPESLAGIMGGAATAVSDATRNVYVEAAFWWPEAVAGRSRRFNFATDAGHRFERGVDPATTVEHIERITRLVVDICGGEPGPIDDHVVALPERKPVRLRVARAARVIGMPLAEAECAGVFERLGLPFTRSAPGELLVAPPSWRFDLALEEDLIEEVIRVLGYARLPEVPPLAPVTARACPEARRSLHAVRHALAERGWFEVITFSFVEERWERELAGNAEPIRVLNPIAAPLAVMRSSLFGSLIEVLRRNLAHKAPRVRVFEVGRVFLRDANAPAGATAVAGVRQPVVVAGLAWGGADELQWGLRERAVDFHDVKGDVEALLAPHAPRFVAAAHPALHPGRCARVQLDGRDIGVVGELHPRWRQAFDLPSAPVLFELDAEALQRRPLPHFEALPRQQSVWRDLAVVVGDDTASERLVEAIGERPLLRSVRVFDRYKPGEATGDIGAGEHSLALRLELRDDDATLTDAQIDAEMAAVAAALRARTNARVRG